MGPSNIFFAIVAYVFYLGQAKQGYGKIKICQLFQLL